MATTATNALNAVTHALDEVTNAATNAATDLCGKRILTFPLFSAAECKQIIAAAEKRGFKQHSVSGGGHGRTGREDPVTAWYSVILNTKLADSIWKRIRDFVPEGVGHLEKNPHFAPGQGWKPHSVHPSLRVLRYGAGESYAEHIDYKQTCTDVLEDGSRCVLQSVYTLLIYLNDDFRGGQTGYWPNHKGIHCRFLRTVEKQHASVKKHQVTVTPETGLAVLQDQNILHEGLPPTKGTKYILRTDVIFERIIPRSAKLKNVPPDPPKQGEWERLFETSCANYAI